MSAGEGCGKEEGECEGRSGGWEYVEREESKSRERKGRRVWTQEIKLTRPQNTTQPLDIT